MGKTPWNKLCVDLIGPFNIRRKGKEHLILKSIIIDPVTGWSEVTKYDDKKAIAIKSLVETMWLSKYPWPSEIRYGCRSEYLGHEFKNNLTDE